MPKITGSIVDAATGEPVPARVQVLVSTGETVHPPDAILKVGPGAPFFYADGAFEVEAPRGAARVVAERGTEYAPATLYLDIPASGVVAADIRMERWNELALQGWHPGNTHLHYDEKEKRPDERLWLDPRIEDLRMTAVSILKRWDLEYASNKYAPGFLTEFSSAHHHVQSGEENRHNANGWEIGYGHVMLLNIRNVVHPVSRGALVDAFDPDYPPLIYACDDAHRQGGVVIWCHNGRGMEAPVAAVLGKLDAFNLFDPYWMDAEYDIYYRMLNAGIRLPASTGSDWFISSANRVYSHTGGPFEYESWLEALKGGRTFITNGPALDLQIDGAGIGSTVETEAGRRLTAVASWKSHYPIGSVEILFNGEVAARRMFPEGSTGGLFETEVAAASDGWIAARLASHARDSFAQPIFAHTSPVYVSAGRASPEQRDAATWFIESIDQSLQWVGSRGKFYTDVQRREVLDLFLQGREAYARMLR